MAVPALPTLLVIPTGVGCAVGGFAGDGLPAARLLAAASGCLITHPNVMNAAALYWSDRRIHYVEGWSLDRFAAGDLALAPVPSQRLGVLLDGGIEAELALRHRQVIAACRASLGLTIGPVLTSEEPLEVTLSIGPSGSSWGTLARPGRPAAGGGAAGGRGGHGDRRGGALPRRSRAAKPSPPTATAVGSTLWPERRR